MSTNHGGPAFPQNDATVNRINNHDGMTLRDYLAAHAMQTGAYQQFATALVKSMAPDGQRVTLVLDHDTTARTAYAIADAMLKAREAK